MPYFSIWNCIPNVMLPASAGSGSLIVDNPITRFKNLSDLINLVKIPNPNRSRIISRWKRLGRPLLREFSPYGSFVLLCHNLFFAGVEARLVTTRASNVIDFEYFKYLPFTQVFASNDKLHSEFCESIFPSCIFSSGESLKPALAELSDYYEELDENLKSRGTFHFADFPPLGLDNEVTRLFDNSLPDWREYASERLSEPPKELPKGIPKELKGRIDAMNRVSDQMDKNRNPVVPKGYANRDRNS